MTASDLKITKIEEQQHIDATGKLVREVVLTFTVGTHGPFVERFDRATFDPVAARNKLNDFVNKLAQLPGLN